MRVKTVRRQGVFVKKSLQLSKDIKLIITDFDGVFTDGTVFIGENGNTFKQISYKDIMGVFLAIKNGYKVAFLSGEKSPAIDYIANKFSIKDVFQDIHNKKEIVRNLIEQNSLTANEVVYIGDDVNDIESMKQVKYKVAPPNANKAVKFVDNIQITEAIGGDGAFREVVDSLIQVD